MGSKDWNLWKEIMRLLIVEDELPIAEDIKEICQNLLGSKLSSIKIELTLGNALLYLSEKQIDVLLLDLNLSGKNGFEILKKMVSYSFHTIIVSANIDRAIEAYEYGKFVHIMDVEGNKIELWEPVDEEYDKILNVRTK